MFSKGFTFRRLARFLPCVFQNVGSGSLSIADKHDIASVRDVFMSAQYWRAFEHVSASPQLIVDLGAHCGHFAVLCHLALLERFVSDSTDYILVEANPFLIPHIRRVVEEVDFSQQVKIIQGLVGKKEGTASFQADRRNLLASSVQSPVTNGETTVLSYLDLDSILPAGVPIDILKIDIEGSEYDLLQNYPHLFLAAKLLLIEVHGTIENQKAFEQQLVTTGFHPLSHTMTKSGERLLCYGRAAAE
jgi:FkbM family methyltransferase